MPNGQLRAALKLIERGRYDSAELQLTRSNLVYTQEMVLIRDSTISRMKETDAALRKLVANFQEQLVNRDQQIAIKNKEIVSEKKKVRKERAIKNVAIVTGVALSAAILIFVK